MRTWHLQVTSPSRYEAIGAGHLFCKDNMQYELACKVERYFAWEKCCMRLCHYVMIFLVCGFINKCVYCVQSYRSSVKKWSKAPVIHLIINIHPLIPKVLVSLFHKPLRQPLKKHDINLVRNGTSRCPSHYNGQLDLLPEVTCRPRSSPRLVTSYQSGCLHMDRSCHLSMHHSLWEDTVETRFRSRWHGFRRSRRAIW